jgi:hypothetical protein
MKSPAAPAKHLESNFTVLVLLFLVAAMLFLTSVVFSQSRQVRFELDQMQRAIGDLQAGS